MVIIGVAVLAWAMPDIGAIYAKQAAEGFSPSWDGNNYWAWSYATYTGQIPNRDFWFPYGHINGTMAPLPHDQMWLTITWLWISLSIWLSLAEFVPSASALMTVLVVLAIHGVGATGGETRYLEATAFVLACTASIKGNARPSLLLQTFALTLAIARADTTQLIYGGVGVIVVVLCLAVFLDLGWRALWKTGTSVAVAMVIAISWEATTGTLPGLIEFYRSLPALTVSSAVWIDLPSFFSITSGSVDAVSWCALFFVLCCSFSLLWWRRNSRKATSAASIGVVCAYAFVMQKQLVRPHMGTQLLPIAVISFLVLMVGWVGHANRSTRLALAAIFVVVFGAYFHFESMPPLARDLLSVPSKTFAAFKVLLKPRDELNQHAMKYFTLGTSAEKDEGLQGIKSCLESHAGFFVLGDRPDLYVTLRRPVPYYQTLYDGSTMAAQKHLIDLLETMQPACFAYVTDYKAFDGVPNIVRAPLLFRFLTENYEPGEQHGEFTMLQRAHSPARSAWRKILGDAIDLGFVPAGAAAAPAQCTSNTCGRFLVMTVPAPSFGRGHSFRITTGGETYSVAWKEYPNQHSYGIALERLWFVAHGDLIQVESDVAFSETLVDMNDRLY